MRRKQIEWRNTIQELLERLGAAERLCEQVYADAGEDSIFRKNLDRWKEIEQRNPISIEIKEAREWAITVTK